jgi:hypothetical protein
VCHWLLTTPQCAAAAASSCSFVPNDLPDIVEAGLLSVVDFAANRQQNGAVRFDFLVWQHGTQVPVDSFPVLSAASTADVRSAAYALYKKLLLAQAEMRDNSSGQHNSDAGAVSRPNSRRSATAGAASVVKSAQQAHHGMVARTIGAFIAATGSLIRLKRMGEGTGPVAAAAKELWQYVGHLSLETLKQLLSGEGLRSSGTLAACKVSKVFVGMWTLLSLGQQQQVATREPLTATQQSCMAGMWGTHSQLSLHSMVRGHCCVQAEPLQLHCECLLSCSTLCLSPVACTNALANCCCCSSLCSACCRCSCWSTCASLRLSAAERPVAKPQWLAYSQLVLAPLTYQAAT